VQEVENFRPDVRIVNLSLFDTDWYINQLRRPFNASEPLPITMQSSQYVAGVHDVIFYQDYNLKGSQKLKDVFEFITSNNPDAKIEYQNGKKDNFLPTKNLTMAVDSNVLLATNTIAKQDLKSIVKNLDWTVGGNYISKGQIAFLDILLHNNWKRPIYFAFTVPSSNFMGLDKYLFNEGFALRLIPKTRNEMPDDSPLGKTEIVNTDIMYHNLMYKFKWGNLKNAAYLDPESSKMVYLSVGKFTELAKNLIHEGKLAQAQKVINYCFKVLPITTTYDAHFALSKYELIHLMYQLGMVQKANNLILQTLGLIDEDLNYQYSINKNKENLNTRQIQLGLFVISEFVKFTSQYSQPTLNKILTNKLAAYDAKFGVGKF
jgi:hypothetical protein